MSSDLTDKTATNRAFERKVRRARWAMIFEQLWIRLWIIAAIVGVFVLVSMLGIWTLLPGLAHKALAGLFGLAMLAALVYAGRVHWPTRDEAIKRIERVSNIPHRPATSYEDTISTVAPDPATMAIWKAHRARMAALMAQLKVGRPAPRTDRHDPFALRALLLLFIVTIGALLGGPGLDRIKSAFQFDGGAANDIRLDAWISPPPYTGKPPMLLADGAAGAKVDMAAAAQPREVPERSLLIVRASGAGLDKLWLQLEGAPAGADRLEPEPTKVPGGVSEIRHELRGTTTVRAMNGSRELARWTVGTIPDRVPRIVLTKKPEVSPRGSMKLTYKVEDDYGVSSAQARFAKAKKKPVDPAKAWAQPEPLKGPRWPEQRPAPLALRLPFGSAKEAEQFTYVEAASHPWAGMKVTMTLEAKDVAGQTGRSEPIEFVMPQKRFTKPLALAIVEQRRKLLEDHRYRDQVRTALAALTLEPETFIEDTKVYLGLRSVYHRLENDRTRAGMRSSIQQLWQIALRIEDGDLSEAERRMKEAQEKLAKALENGASDEEIKKLMDELKQALSDYMQQLAKEQGEDEMQEGQSPEQQMMSQQDLERMMQELEEQAKNGSREQAQQLLSEMQDMMERLQAGKMTEKQRQQNKDMKQAMDELGDMAGKQQDLMDETFEELRKKDGEGRNQGKPNVRKTPGGEKGKGAEGSNSDNPDQQTRNRAQPGEGQRSRGQGGRGQQGAPEGTQPQRGAGQSEDGEGAGQGGDGGQIRQRQQELRDRLAKLQRGLKEKGLGESEKLQGAEESMRSAEDALDRGDLEEATQHQGDALEQMREGGQEMADQMDKNSPQRTGRNGDTPRDPLGRPQRSQGPDLGTSVKVPDEIERQRAREILDELRRRSSEASRPPVELDYLERLLKRF